MYYNTTNEKGKQFEMFNKQTEKQNAKVLRLCRESIEFTASSIFKKFQDNTPLTSIRRALNTLEKNGLISKTKTKLTGMFGKPETLYISLEAC